jgi:hypothetical protein
MIGRPKKILIVFAKRFRTHFMNVIHYLAALNDKKVIIQPGRIMRSSPE